jgi:hypothetical protein
MVGNNVGQLSPREIGKFLATNKNDVGHSDVVLDRRRRAGAADRIRCGLRRSRLKMTNAIGGGIVLESRFRDSFCFHVRLAKLLDRQMPGLIERLKILHGEIVGISEPKFLR